MRPPGTSPGCRPGSCRWSATGTSTSEAQRRDRHRRQRLRRPQRGQGVGGRHCGGLLGPSAGAGFPGGDETGHHVPPGKLQTIPWGLLPALRDCVITVAPSAVAWMRAWRVRPPSRRHGSLARGPGLVTDGAEVPAVARFYDDVAMLADSHDTTAKVLHAIDGAWLAHIAAYGVFRAGSSLFSSLRMHDGPLTVYDFEQLHSAPYRMVLSSCDSAVGAPAGADEVLGLVSSLLPLGTAGIIAALVPLNDHAAVPAVVGLHRHLRAAGRTSPSRRPACGTDSLVTQFSGQPRSRWWRWARPESSQCDPAGRHVRAVPGTAAQAEGAAGHRFDGEQPISWTGAAVVTPPESAPRSFLLPAA